MSGEEAAVALIFFGGAFWVLRPVAAALAKRIAGEVRPPAPDPAERDQIVAELHQLRAEMTELNERVDFAERLLAKQREPGGLAPPR